LISHGHKEAALEGSGCLGIAGAISRRPRGENDTDVERMLACIKHDPPYAIGLYSNDIFSISVGVLSLKGSFSDCNSHGIAKLTEFLDDELVEIAARAHQSEQLRSPWRTGSSG